MSRQRISLRPGAGGLLLAAAMASHAMGGSVVFVDDDAPAGGDGTTWDTAYRFLQDAIAFASDPGHKVTEIHVGEGIYRPDRDEANPSGTGDRLASFQLINGVALMGGYAGIGAIDPDARDIELYETILSGDLLGNDGEDFENNPDNSYHVVTANDTDVTAVLDGFTITAGNANASFPDSVGGACFAQTGFYTMRSCRFIENFALGGGAIYNNGSDPSITDCLFENNLASSTGGAMFNDSSQPTIIGCEFLSNTVSTGSGGAMLNDNGSDATIMDCIISGNTAAARGAGIRNLSSSPSFIRCVFSNNSGVNNGGGMHNEQSSPSILDCTFSNNFANSGGGAVANQDFSSPLIQDCTFESNGGGAGGALQNGRDCNPLVLNCEFSDNEASNSAGGAILNFDAGMFAVNCSFWSNNARVRGGAVYNSEESNIVFLNCLFTENTGFGSGGVDADGGAVFNILSTITLINCGFFSNTAEDDGGAIYNWTGTTIAQNCLLVANEAIGEEGGAVFNRSDGLVTMTNCTLVCNSSPTMGGGVYSLSALTSLTNYIVWNNVPDQAAGDAVSVNYSCIMDGFAGLGNIDVDPLFVDPGESDFRLAPTSPCIDAGDNTAVPPDDFDLDQDGDNSEPLPIDLDGNPRFVDDLFTDDTGNGEAPLVDMGAYEFMLDCNNNGVPDSVDIMDGTSEDCNDNSIPDECDVVPPFFAESGELGPIGFKSPQTFIVASPPSAADVVSLTFTAFADLLSRVEFIDVDINGVPVGSIFVEGAQDCPKTPDADEIIIPAAVYNDAVGGGDAVITMTATNAVNPLACEGNNYITVALHYSLGGMSDDDNNNGIPDECETPGDLNGDGMVGVADLLILLSNWGPCADCDDCVADLDDDCSVGVSDLLILLANWG